MSKLKRKGSGVRKAVSKKTCRGQGTEYLGGIDNGHVEETKSKLLGSIGFQEKNGKFQ